MLCCLFEIGSEWIKHNWFIKVAVSGVQQGCSILHIMVTYVAVRVVSEGSYELNMCNVPYAWS